MRSNSPRILLVDDIAENRAILSRRLTRRGFEIFEASGGRSALEQLETDVFDCVLLDIMMPDINGIDVLRQIRAQPALDLMPVIMVSANHESEETATALRIGANDYVTKPVDFTVAFARIESQLLRRNAQLDLKNELDQADKRLRSLVEFLPSGLALKDTSGHFLIINARYGAYLGFNPQDAIGQKQDSLGNIGAAEISKLDASVLASCNVETIEISVDSAPAGRRMVVTSFPILCSNLCIGIGTSLVDVTSRCQAERELIIAKEAAEAGNRAKSEFLAAMSHELRTPLNAIIGFAEAMADEIMGPLDNAIYTGYARDIGQSGRHLLGVINDVLDMAKNEAGSIDLNEEEVEISSIIKQCLNVVSQVAERAGVSIIDETQNRYDPIMMGDRRRLTQIILNLLSNAIKFTPQGGRVEVGWAMTPDGFVLNVTDTGIGMEEKDISIALEPFRQIDSKLSRKYDGTGLGLPISKKLCELHGGHLSIGSKPNRGTTVTVTLPLHRVVRFKELPPNAMECVTTDIPSAVPLSAMH